MSTRRILTCCLGLSMLVFLGCSDNVTEPESSAGTTEIATAQPSSGEVVGIPSAYQCYFPLHEGDRWVYAVSEHGDEEGGGQLAEVTVTGRQIVNGYVVCDLDNYLFPISDSPTRFFNNEILGEALELSGEVFGCWYPWSRFGEDFVLITLPDFVQDCIHGSEGICLGLGTVTVPAGTFHRTATIYYGDIPCADLGLAQEVLAPGVGLIERTTYTIQGQQTWSLVYAKVGDREWGELAQP